MSPTILLFLSFSLISSADIMRLDFPTASLPSPSWASTSSFVPPCGASEGLITVPAWCAPSCANTATALFTSASFFLLSLCCHTVILLSSSSSVFTDSLSPRLPDWLLGVITNSPSLGMAMPLSCSDEWDGSVLDGELCSANTLDMGVWEDPRVMGCWTGVGDRDKEEGLPFLSVPPSVLQPLWLVSSACGLYVSRVSDEEAPPVASVWVFCLSQFDPLTSTPRPLSVTLSPSPRTLDTFPSRLSSSCPWPTAPSAPAPPFVSVRRFSKVLLPTICRECVCMRVKVEARKLLASSQKRMKRSACWDSMNWMKQCRASLSWRISCRVLDRRDDVFMGDLGACPVWSANIQPVRWVSHFTKAC